MGFKSSARWPGLTVRKYLPLRDTPAPGGGGGDGAAGGGKPSAALRQMGRDTIPGWSGKAGNLLPRGWPLAPSQ